MTMTDDSGRDPDTTTKPKTKRAKRKYRRRVDAPKPEVPQEFAGISVSGCCDECHTERCVISGKAYCAHPAMCGLQAGDMMNPEIVQRYRRAKRVVDEIKLNARNGA